MRVLIADDEALTRMGLRAMLQDMGHVLVGAAADGGEALRLACSARPELAILDIKMPVMDGLSVAEEISRQCPLPVIMLTAHSERELIERAVATETVQAYLVKPVREAGLGPVIELAVSRYSEWRILRQEAADRQSALAAREVVDQAKQILISRQDLTERQAFLEIQHRARRERRTMRQVAETILSSSS